METKIWKYIQKYKMIDPGDHVVVGVSGGADSVCLLILLCQFSEKIPFTMEVVHVNHGLRPEAYEEAAYVRTLCRERNLPFHLVETDIRQVAESEGMSEEEAGRKIRYEAFDKLCKNWQKSHGGKAKIAVAHHENDRAETLLFNLFRGTGLSGLCGIKPVRDNVIRPLLCLEREEIELYLKKHNISYCHDASNDKDEYSRNKIRHHVIPCAEEIVENAVTHMNNTAEILEETWEYISLQIQRLYDKCVTCKDEEVRIDIFQLQREEKLIQKYVLLEAIGKAAGSKKDITKRHLEAVMELLCKAGSHQLNLPYGLTVKKEYGDLFIRGKREEQHETLEDIAVTVPMTVWLSDGKEIEFSVIENVNFSDDIPQNKYTKWFDYDKIEQSLIVRGRRSGDYLTINRELSKKTLKEYMIEEKIPKDIRDLVPVLADGNHVIWVMGYRISEKYKVNENTKRILQVQLRGGQ